MISFSCYNGNITIGDTVTWFSERFGKPRTGKIVKMCSREKYHWRAKKTRIITYIVVKPNNSYGVTLYNLDNVIKGEMMPIEYDNKVKN